MSTPIVNIQGYLTTYSLPPIASHFNELQMTKIVSDFQQQHYNDHAMYYQVLSGFTKALNLGVVQMSLPNLFFSDTPSFNNFLYNNNNDHSKFYLISNEIAKALATQGYGKLPIVLNFMGNSVASVDKYDFNNANKFMLEEYNIHRMFTRYLNILTDTLNNQNIPLAGGS